MLETEYLQSESELQSESPIPVQNRTNSFNFPLLTAFIALYILIAISLFVRLLRIIHMIQMKAERNPKKLYQNCELVLLNEKVVPHSFMNTIFVNRSEYESGHIGKDILIHEQTHVRQKHTWDLLFIEFLKIIFWFNPVLYLYKKAILLNHEFLADQAVIQSGSTVKDYQSLLLNTLLAQPLHGLSHSLNYSLTIKRLYMMTQPQSGLRSTYKLVTLIPLILIMGYLFGCESTPADSDRSEMDIVIEFTDSEQVVMNGEEIQLAELEEKLKTLAGNHELFFIIEDHPDMMAGPVMKVNQLVQRYRSVDQTKPGKALMIEITNQSELKFEDETYSIDELDQLLDHQLSDPNLIISLRVSKEADMGTILDVQRLLRSKQISRINYSTISPVQSAENLLH